MKNLTVLICLMFLSCGGGGSVASSTNTSSSPSSNSNSTLLPGSVGSFQPIDIDD